MKRLLILICALLLVFLSNKNFAQQTKDNMTYPYTAKYSSNFQVGNPAQSKMVLELWKDWDDNVFDRHNYFADTIVMFFPDGSRLRGKDSCLAGAKKYRGSMSTAVSTIQAWVPLKSVDRNQDWVIVWGSEADTFPDGKKATKDLHEIWRFNKDGKVDFMKQFASEPNVQ
jgi:hypothetical protein